MTKFLNALLYDKVSLESSEEEVKSISLIISETYLLSPSTWNFTFIIPFFIKNVPHPFLNNLEAKLLFS